ncbi:hypothetical protein ACS0TY_017072 [Phlomoides rotata]
MLFVDETFMKGFAEGTLLATTAKDGDNGLFLVALAVISTENTINWAWFLKKLRDNIKHEKHIFYIFDHNLGLMAAFPMVFDEPIHFLCLYHLLTNLKGRFFSGWSNTHQTTLGIHFKDCAYPPTKRIFDENVVIFKEVGGKIAEDWLTQLPYEKWVMVYVIPLLMWNMSRQGRAPPASPLRPRHHFMKKTPGEQVTAVSNHLAIRDNLIAGQAMIKKDKKISEQV